MTSVLVTDSDETVCELIAAGLRRRGCEVRFARDGREGLAAYEKFRPKLVITEIMLPAMNGYQLIRGIKQRERENGGEECRIIVLTGIRAKHKIERCMRLGAADCVLKPFCPVELEDRIRSHLADLNGERMPDPQHAGRAVLGQIALIQEECP